MPPPDQPQRPKPVMPAAAREAMAAREAAAAAKASAGKPPVRVVAAPPVPVEPPRPRMEVGLAGFAVWLLAAVMALGLFYNFKVTKAYLPFVLYRKIGAGVLAGVLFLAIWCTQAIEKDARIVKLVWVFAVLTMVAAPVAYFLMRA